MVDTVKIQELIGEYLEDKNTDNFDINAAFNKFIKSPEIKAYINKIKGDRRIKTLYEKSKLSIEELEELINVGIFETITRYNKEPHYYYFNITTKGKVRDHLSNELNKKDKEIHKLERNKNLSEEEKEERKAQISSIIYYDHNYGNREDDGTNLLDTIKSQDKTPEEKTIFKINDKKGNKIYEQIKSFLSYLKKQYKERYILVLYYICCNNYKNLSNYKNLMYKLQNDYELSDKLNIKKEPQISYEDYQYIRSILNFCEKNNYLTEWLPNFDFSFACYAQLIQYCKNLQNKKHNLIENFLDGVRTYLLQLFNNNLTNITSTEREKRNRLKDLYELEKIKEEELKEELLNPNKTPDNFSKIYDIHKVPNLVFYLLILDALEKYPYTKLSDLRDDLLKKKLCSDKDENSFQNKLPERLQELANFGLVNKNLHNLYSLNAKFLTKEQKKQLKYVIPFFSGIYPFASIGHFLANKLKISDIFTFENFNIQNIVDDCETYELLEEINNHQTVTLNLYENDKKIEFFQPARLSIDKNDFLIKIEDNDKNSYYLHEIRSIEYPQKEKSPIFSEIYSFYYKIFEEIVEKYKKSKSEKAKKYNDQEIEADINAILNKYPFYKDVIPLETIKELLKTPLIDFENIEIPLTTLEQRYLKTIMQDERFDLLLQGKKEILFKDLLNDETIKPFDLSNFMIWNGKKYQSINTYIVKNKNSFQKSFQQECKKKKDDGFLVYSKISDDFKIKN